MRARVLDLARGALAALEPNRQRIDDLNVFPVPDGDTGTNLVLTVRAVVDDLEASGTEERDALAAEITRAALMGARGNSGVILSQAVRGAAEVLRGTDDLAAALRGASDAAYRAVKKPVEGTMLTALRELAEEAERGSDLAAIVSRGDDCVARTTEMLPALKEAGVVDAGAAGLLEIVRGIAGVLAGVPMPEAPARATAVLTDDLIHQELSPFRYCTVFVVEGDDLDVDAIERELEPLGDSLLVVGDRSAVKAHVHTDDPGRALSLGVARGALSGVEIANMHAQTQERERRLLQAVPASGAPVRGGRRRERNRQPAPLREPGSEGRRRRPDDESLDRRHPRRSRGVIRGRGRRAPERHECPDERRAGGGTRVEAGARHSGRLDPGRARRDGCVRLAQTRSRERRRDGRCRRVGRDGAVTIASRDVDANGVAVRKGAWLGLADGEPVAAGESFDEVARTVLARLLAEPRGFLTLLTGEEPPSLEALLAELESSHPGLEFEVHDGGQPHYALLLSAE